MNRVLQAGQRVARRFMQRTDYAADYKNDLALEGMLAWHDVTQDRSVLDHVLTVLDVRGAKPGDGLDWRRQQFVCLDFALFLATEDEAHVARFVEVARAYRENVPRTADGAVAHFYRPETNRIFVDMLQGYATFMARAGWRSGDERFFDESVEQYVLFRKILRDPETGLWRQGRGWGPSPDVLAPIGWLRGQGWLIRGMVESLTYIPADHAAHRRMRDMLVEFAGDLLRYQDGRGMWHQVAQRADSYPETTGTGLIVHYLCRAVAQGLLPADPYRLAARRGALGLAGFVTRDGTVLNGSRGTGPLGDLEHYLHRPAAPGDPHTIGTTLLGCAGPLLSTRDLSRSALES